MKIKNTEMNKDPLYKQASKRLSKEKNEEELNTLIHLYKIYSTTPFSKLRIKNSLENTYDKTGKNTFSKYFDDLITLLHWKNYEFLTDEEQKARDKYVASKFKPNTMEAFLQKSKPTFLQNIKAKLKIIFWIIPILFLLAQGCSKDMHLVRIETAEERLSRQLTNIQTQQLIDRNNIQINNFLHHNY